MYVEPLSSTAVILVVSLFSIAWFVLGIVVGRYIAELPAIGLVRSEAKARKAETGMEMYVGNLSYDVGEKDLLSAFERFGKVTSARIITHKFSGKSKGFGFVEMFDRTDATAAIRSLNGKEVKGRRIVVNEAKSSARDA